MDLKKLLIDYYQELDGDATDEMQWLERRTNDYLTLPSKQLLIQRVSNQRELLIAFAEDWYKDNPMVGREKIEVMVDKYLGNS